MCGRVRGEEEKKRLLASEDGSKYAVAEMSCRRWTGQTFKQVKTAQLKVQNTGRFE